MRKSTILLSVVGLLIGGCATQPEKIQPSYVSHLEYTDYSCSQIKLEVSSISRQVDALQGHLKKKADDDAAQMGIGLILFWPALFFLEGGDGAEAAEYAELKGRYEALERTAIEKDCAMISNASEGELREAADSISDCGIARQDLLEAATAEAAEIAAVQVKALCN